MRWDCPSCKTDSEVGLIENENTVPMDSIIDERETNFAGNAFQELKIEMGKHGIKIRHLNVNGLLLGVNLMFLRSQKHI